MGKLVFNLGYVEFVGPMDVHLPSYALINDQRKIISDSPVVTFQQLNHELEMRVKYNYIKYLYRMNTNRTKL